MAAFLLIRAFKFIHIWTDRGLLQLLLMILGEAEEKRPELSESRARSARSSFQDARSKP